MDKFDYTLKITSEYLFANAEVGERTFDYNISVSDEAEDQMIKISPKLVFERGGKRIAAKTDFYYLVPYGQNLINFNDIVKVLTYQSFLKQVEYLRAKFSGASLPEIPPNFDKK